MSERKIVYSKGTRTDQVDEGARVPHLSEALHKITSVWCSDIHLSHRPPIARSAEPCWYSAMRRQLDQLREVANQHNVPIFVVGDIFDRWNPPPELINFAIKYMPRCYAIPGQHDLPYHSYADIKKSAYWTLVEAGVIVDLPPGQHGVGDLIIHSFPWGTPLTPCPDNGLSIFGLNVMMAHIYVWSRGHGYPHAPKDRFVGDKGHLRKVFDSYGACFTGDNHTAFSCYPYIVNCGGFFRRKSDEEESKPSIYLLRKSGRTLPVELNCAADKFLQKTELDKFVKDARTVEKFIDDLGNLNQSVVDFKDAIDVFLTENKVMPEVKSWILKSLEE